jgi:hypothetical protein
MISEPHVPGTEFGELQRAIWTKQFRALRDGDRFFYGNDPGLSAIQARYGIDFHRTLAQVIASNTDIPASELNENVFLVPDDDLPATTCTVSYRIFDEWTDAYRVDLTITNTSSRPTKRWSLKWDFASGQRLHQVWNGTLGQSRIHVTITNASWNAVIPAGGSLTGVGFIGNWDNTTNPKPPNFTLNGKRCAFG